ncbi:MAG: tetratricopeptide repeat protein [Armatimonadetes bacterium]|nr:tetratricopeptide repeat protein [Armatimonadota bacterium]
MSSLGQRIREARKQLGMTQAQLAEPDLTKGFISLVETGRARPSLKSLEQIAQRLGKSVSSFLEDGEPAAGRDLAVVLKQGEAALRQRRWSEAVRTFQAAAEVTGDAPPAARAALQVGWGEALLHQGQMRHAQERLTEGLQQAREARAPEETARALRGLGLIELQHGRLPQAIEHLRPAARALEEGRLEARHLHASTLIALGRAYGRAGQQDEALGCVRQALDLLETTANLAALSRAYLDSGIALHANGQRERALVHLQRAVDVLELVESQHLLAGARQHMAVILLERGAIDEALPHLYESLRLRERLGGTASPAATLIELARAHLARRDPARAESYVGEAMIHLKKEDEPATRARAQAVLGLIRRQQGKVAEAIMLLEKAARQLARLDLPLDLAGVYHDLGRIHADRDDQAKAAGAYRRALEALRSADTLGGLGRLSSLP